ncbi:MAG TPA: 3-methyl-2-oxobutanoate hydroxymethyltransferase [Burkholderiaceae bacterium]|nr:3-methyl-2-oxobutanoate hydroxymethyltransferase [Burkholderiaceae bacterium]HQR69075.1 3-methyl-2-oxobutanoate hydroxymethyltransferase [Burkholderiaceae bacterium]
MSTHPQTPDALSRRPVSLPRLREMRAAGEPIAMLTCYDASFARLLDAAGVDCVLVGDSLGMVVQGLDSTLPVTVADVAYHTRCVARGLAAAWLIADMPFGSYQAGPEQALAHAVELMQAGAKMVKLEGGAWLAPTVAFLVERGIPVCGHLGLTPQSVHALGGYRIQGRTESDAERLIADARALDAAGAAMLVLELIPAALAARVTQAVGMPTIGIGAGAGVSGQVLVLHDMLDVYPGKKPRFVRNFMQGQPTIGSAVAAYVTAVKDRSFPGPEHGY